MKTSVIEVRDMLSVLSVLGVETRIGAVPGVESVTVNFSAGNATVRYDETRLDISEIKSGVRQRGSDDYAVRAAPVGHRHDDHAAPAAPTSIPGTATSKDATSKPAEPVSAGTDASGASGASTADKAALPAAATPEAAARDNVAASGSKEMSMPDKG